MFVKTIAIGIAGFLAGGSVLLGMAGIFGIDGGAASFLIYIIGGVIGVILVSVLFDWAIITLSSLAGASLIIPAIGIGPVLARVGFLALVILGVVIQGAGLRKEKKHD
jgi:hypothetical protein